MADESPPPADRKEPAWVTTLAEHRPDAVLMAPYMAYLVLLAFNDRVPEAWMPLTIALRGAGALWVTWVFRHRFPPFGKWHVGPAVLVGVLAAVGWVAGQHLFNALIEGSPLEGKWYIFKIPEAEDPRANISAASWYAQAVLRITVACTTVPIVEEIFWRAFLLRAFIDWDRFDKIPLGTFTWKSFLITSLLSTLQHPSNWAVSIFCWFAFNGLMYWTKSIRCMILCHGITNLVLYIYVLIYEDWMFW